MLIQETVTGKPAKMQRVRGWSCSGDEIEFNKIVGGKKYKYCVVLNGSIVARFDNEERGNMYFNGFCEGLEKGYSIGWRKREDYYLKEKDEKNINKRLDNY